MKFSVLSLITVFQVLRSPALYMDLADARVFGNLCGLARNVLALQ